METPGLSYSAQYDLLFSRQPLDSRQRLPKPSQAAQAKAPGAKLVPLSHGLYATPKLHSFFGREPWSFVDVVVAGSIVGLHLLCLAAPWTFTWPAFYLCCTLFCLVGCLGIDVSFHRQLTHRSFATPKWLEYALAFIGTCGLEMDPIRWVRYHRFHHANCDSALDPHTPFEGFFWAHCGWLFHERVLEARAGDNWIVSDLVADPFYRLLHWSYPLVAVGQYALLYWFGGWPGVVWGGAVRQVAMWHVTWLVNSACHVWGSRPYQTPDLSTNCAWLALPTFGEAFHNNHHAFPYSARHGLEWWQFDITWYIIRALQAVGLAHDIRLPTAAQKQKMRAANGGANCGAIDRANGGAAGGSSPSCEAAGEPAPKAPSAARGDAAAAD